jgi:tRNA-specific 2-thiouridylase
VEDAHDARAVAWRLGIRFYVLNAYPAFEAEVVVPFAEAYRSHRTPNPCVLCNRRVKFRWLLDRVLAAGCEALATGHYARLEGVPGGRVLRKGLDPAKDQSYFVAPEGREVLDRLLFPLGGRAKGDVREIARARGLPVAEKGESQDACFLPQGGLGEFLARRLGPDEPGEVVDVGGRPLGRHRGLRAYTVGQRRGLGLSAPAPLYVVGKEAAVNRLVVGPREGACSRGFLAAEASWLDAGPPAGPFACGVKIRSTAREVPCTVAPEGEGLRVAFAAPQFGVAPGQLAVFYDGDRVLGSAWIGAPVAGQTSGLTADG